MKNHKYAIDLSWTGNLGEGTRRYNAYERSFKIGNPQKNQEIEGSSDPAFLGDPTKFNPEEMLVASISSCHMLWYLHLCAINGIEVINYRDSSIGNMMENEDGSGQFTEVELRPQITLASKSMQKKANELHKTAHKKCFIARSCNFEIKHCPEYLFKE